MSKDKFNPRQMKFVDGIEKGMSLVDAYLKAGYKAKKENGSIYTAASALFRKVHILAELAKRRSNRKDTVDQRLSTMSDLSTNVYIKIMQIDSDDPEILRLQQKTASDILDRNGHKPKEEVEHSGEVDVNLIDMLRGIRAKNQAESE